MLTEHKYTTGYCFLQQICHLQSLTFTSLTWEWHLETLKSEWNKTSFRLVDRLHGGHRRLKHVKLLKPHLPYYATGDHESGPPPLPPGPLQQRSPTGRKTHQLTLSVVAALSDITWAVDIKALEILGTNTWHVENITGVKHGKLGKLPTRERQPLKSPEIPPVFRCPTHKQRTFTKKWS